jgi:hypothetical protein
MNEDLSRPRDIKTAMEAHTAELMSIPGVTGVAVGLTHEQKPCVIVLVVRLTKELRKKIPVEVEGHPVKIMVSGEIRGMPG